MKPKPFWPLNHFTAPFAMGAFLGCVNDSRAETRPVCSSFRERSSVRRAERGGPSRRPKARWVYISHRCMIRKADRAASSGFKAFSCRERTRQLREGAVVVFRRRRFGIALPWTSVVDGRIASRPKRQLKTAVLQFNLLIVTHPRHAPTVVQRRIPRSGR